MPAVRRPRRPRSQRGTALLELALSAPLFLSLVYGIWVIASLTRAQHQVAMVSHAVMRVAAAGVADGYALSHIARVYADSIGMGKGTRLVVDTGWTSLGIGGRDGGRRSEVNPGLTGFPAGGIADVDSPAIMNAFGQAMTGAIRVRVIGIVPVGGPLGRVWPQGVPIECACVCMPDPWTSPFAMLKGLIRIPGV